MTVLEVIEREKACVLRQDTVYCNRDCANCNLVLDSNTVLKAYDAVIAMLKQE